MSNKAYYFGGADGLARLMRKMYFGLETEVPVYEEQEVTRTEQLSVANIGDFFEVSNFSGSAGWVVSDYAEGELNLVPGNIGVNSSTAQIYLKTKRALQNVVISGAYYTESNYDKITLVANLNTVLDNVSGSSSFAQRYKSNMAEGTYIRLYYVKDSSNHASGEANTLFRISCDDITTTKTEQVQVGTETKALARKVIRAYQPDANGKAQLWFDADAAGINVTFTGEHTVQDVTVDGVARKLYTLTGDGVLTVSGAVSFFMIGGGSSGEHAGIGGYGGFCSGRGGCGGKVVSGVLTANEPVTVTIGKGGAKAENSGYNAGTATTLSGVLMPTYTADGGTILAGGTGGGAGADCSSAGQFSVAGGSGAGVSTMPFGLADLGKPGGGGGGGAVYSTNYGRYSGGNGGTDGGNGSNGVKGNYTPGSGGADGGGKGGSNGSDGSDATGKGSGGGGGAAYYPGSDARYGKGGAGADGAVWLLV